MSILNEDSSCFDVLCKINVEGVFFHWSVDARFLIEASVTVPCNGCHSHVGRSSSWAQCSCTSPSICLVIHLLVLSTHQGYHLDIWSNFVFQEYLFRPEVFPALAFLIHPASADVLTMFRQWVFSTSAVCLRLCVTTKKESEGGAECLRGLWRTWGERNTEVKILWTEHCLCGRKIERWSPVYQICKSVGYNAPWKSFKMKHSVTIMFIPQSLKVWGVTSQVPRCSFKSGREPG